MVAIRIRSRPNQDLVRRCRTCKPSCWQTRETALAQQRPMAGALQVALPAISWPAIANVQPMLRAHETVFFRTTAGSEHKGIVLGSESENCWLWVPDLGNVYQGHPDWVISLSDRKIFWKDDRCKAAKDIFDERGEYISDIFWEAKDPKPMIDLLRVFKMAGAF